MEEDSLPAVSEENVQGELANSVERSRQSWKRFGLRIRSITPSGLVRILLIAGAFVILFLILRATWVALTPFIVGAVVAYVVLPFVNRLDRFMPRFLAVVIVLVAVVLAAGAFFTQVAPVIGQQLFRMTGLLPTREEIRAFADDLRQWYQTLPEPTQLVVDDLIDQVGETLRGNFDIYLSHLVDLSIQTVLNLINTVAFILGFLVVPAWLLAVLKDHRTGVESINRLLPRAMRADFWAIVRIVDRTFRAFIDGQLVLGIIVGALVYLGLFFFEQFGIKIADYKLVVAIFAGLMQLIPSVGPVIASVLLFVAGSLTSLETGLTILALYIAVQLLVGQFAAPRLEGRYIDIHPAVMVVAIVALSEFGVLWVLLAAPVTAIVRDTYRYVYGRFREPPSPAGVLPGAFYETESQSLEPEPSTIHVPLAYRRGRDNKSA